MGVVGRLDQYASMLSGEFDDYSMSENLLTYSEQFNNAVWILTNSPTITANSDVSPDGTTTAELFTRTTTASSHITQTYTKSASAIQYTFSIFAKKSVGDYCALRTQGAYPSRADVVFNLNLGTISSTATAFSGFTGASASINEYSNGWYRLTLTATSDTATVFQPYTSFNSTGGVLDITDSVSNSAGFLWGAQLETGSVATDYTPTTTTAINRVLASTTNTNITGLGTYYASEFSENVGITTTLTANVFPPYDPVYDEFGGTLFGAGQGRYMRQNTDKSVIVYNEIDEISDFRDIVRSGLVLDLDAGMNASFNNTGTTWTDLSGSGNNGTLVNGPTYSSGNGGYIVLDGTNDFITSTFSTTSGQAVTYCGWMYSTETTATYRNFIDSVTLNPMIWWNTSGQIEFDAASYTTTTVYRNQWVYVALSKPSGSSSASYYVNGVLVGSGGAYTTPALTPTWFNRAAGQTWKGNCSNVQAYNRALPATEILQNYNALKHRFGL